VHAFPVANASATPDAGAAPSRVRILRAVLAVQVVVGLLWGISMLFFASAIALGDRSGPHIEKIAMEGCAHFTLVLGAILVWRFPREARLALLMMIFLNAIWAVTDLVYIPLFALTAIDFSVKLVVNSALAVGLLVAGRRARIIFS
jgi:hypothetical protein